MVIGKGYVSNISFQEKCEIMEELPSTLFPFQCKILMIKKNNVIYEIKNIYHDGKTENIPLLDEIAAADFRVITQKDFSFKQMGGLLRISDELTNKLLKSLNKDKFILYDSDINKSLKI